MRLSVEKDNKSISLNAVRQLPGTMDRSRVETILNIFKGVEEYILDVKGIIVSSNLEAVTITGYEEWEVIGRHFSIFYSSEDQIKREYDVDLDKAARQGYCSVSGIKMKKRNSPFWSKMKITALLDESEVVSGFRLTIQDASHKALYAHNFHLVKDEYLNLFNNPFIGIFKFRFSDYKLMLVNEKAESLFGKDWNKCSLDSYFVDQNKFQSLIAAIDAEKKVEGHEFEVTDSAGAKHWVSISCKLFSSVGFVEGVIIDISERKKEIERTLSLSNELESFIYHASHDLRSPITSIYGLVHLLQKDDAVDKVSKYTKLIEGRLLHLDNILRDIVEIAFNTAVPLQREKIDFKTEVESILSIQSKMYPEVASSVEVMPSPHAVFLSDLTRLRSIFRNVISNAFKYNNPGGNSYVRVLVEVTDEYSLITIRDNGIGIQAEHTSKIFSLFYKATESYKGNGLGLYIVKSMIIKLGGTIKIESSIGGGTVVKISIPNEASKRLLRNE